MFTFFLKTPSSLAEISSPLTEGWPSVTASGWPHSALCPPSLLAQGSAPLLSVKVPRLLLVPPHGLQRSLPHWSAGPSIQSRHRLCISQVSNHVCDDMDSSLHKSELLHTLGWHRCRCLLSHEASFNNSVLAYTQARGMTYKYLIEKPLCVTRSDLDLRVCALTSLLRLFAALLHAWRP